MSQLPPLSCVPVSACGVSGKDDWAADIVAVLPASFSNHVWLLEALVAIRTNVQWFKQSVWSESAPGGTNDRVTPFMALVGDAPW